MAHKKHNFNQQLTRFLQGQLSGPEQEQFEEHTLSCQHCADAVHDQIHQDEFIDRYLLGKLSRQETELLETHCLVCGSCFQELKETEKIVVGLQAAAERNEIQFDELKTSVFDLAWEWLGSFATSPKFALGAIAVILILIYPAWLGVFKLPRFHQELRQLSSSQANSPAFSLDLVSSRTGGQVIRLPERAETGIVILTFSLLSKSEEPRNYRGEITDAAGNVIYRAENLLPYGEFEVFALFCPRALFRAGKYELKIFELDSENLAVTQEFVYHFEIVWQ